MTGGAVLGGTVRAASYAELVPLGIQEPPWRYPLGELSLDLSYHLVYRAGVAGAFAALDHGGDASGPVSSLTRLLNGL